MRGRFIYKVSHKLRPVNFEEFFCLNDVAEFLETSPSTVKKAIKENTRIKGYNIYRDILSEDFRREDSRGCIVFYSNGTSKTFPTLSNCAEELTISVDSIRTYISKGICDRFGRFYDYPLD